MSNEIETILDNVGIKEMVEELTKNRDKILSEFAKAYLAETETTPSEVELVEKRMPEENGIIETVYYFRRINEQKEDGDTA